VTAYLDLLLRGLGLTGQAGAIGGVFFIVLVLRPVLASDLRLVLARSRWLVTASGVGVILAQCLALVLQLESLGDRGGWPVREFLGTAYFSVSVVRIIASGA
jgi:hypothetical protein